RPCTGRTWATPTTRRGAVPGVAGPRRSAGQGLGGRRGDAMVLDRNELARHAWRASGYAPQPQWTRWVKPLGDR
ncbi:hypothetical protein ACFRPW_34300, partial [Streptomyces sp. NPDC056907]